MTEKRDLKRRIRERAAETGERYTTARQRVIAKRGRGRPPFVVMENMTELAATLGLRCDVHVQPELAERVDCSAALVRIRDVLRATEKDPKTELLRSIMLRGEQPLYVEDPTRQPPRRKIIGGPLAHEAQRASLASLRGVLRRQSNPRTSDIETFLTRALAGIGGISEHGVMLALEVMSGDRLEMVVCFAATMSTPAVFLMSPADFFPSGEHRSQAPRSKRK